MVMLPFLRQFRIHHSEFIIMSGRLFRCHPEQAKRVEGSPPERIAALIILSDFPERGRFLSVFATNGKKCVIMIKTYVPYPVSFILEREVMNK